MPLRILPTSAPTAPPAPPLEPFARPCVLALLAILALGASLRAVCVWRSENIARDGVRYVYMARHLTMRPTADAVRAFDYHPGYSAAIALLARTTGAAWTPGWIRCGQWISVVAGVLTLLAVYYIAARTFRPGIGLAAAAMAAVSGAYVEVSANLISDAFALMAAAGAVAFALAALRALREARWQALGFAALSGTASALAYLTRPEGLLSGVVALVLLLLPARLGARGRLVQAFALVTLLAVTLAGILPYAMTIDAFTQKKGLDDFVLSTPGPLFVATLFGEDGFADAIRRAVDRLRAAMGTPLAVLCLIAVGGWLAAATPRFRRAGLLAPRPTPEGLVVLLVPLGIMLPLVIALEYRQSGSYISSRHLLLPATFLMPLAGAGVLTLGQLTAVAAGRIGFALRAAPATAFWAGVLAVGLLVQAFPVLHEGKACFRQAGLALRERLGPDARILTNDVRVALHAEADPLQFGNGSPLPANADALGVHSPQRLLACLQLAEGGSGYEAVALSDRLVRTHPTLADWPSLLPAGEFEAPLTFTSSRKDTVRVCIRRRPESPATTPRAD